MAISRLYKFYIEISGTLTELDYDDMLFGDDIAIKGESPDGEYFHRETMSATVGFTGKAYFLVQPLSIADEWFFVVYKDNGTGTFSERWRGRTTRIKGKWLEYSNTVNISFESVDRYTLVIDGKSKRFNLVELAPDLVNVTFERYGLIQIYVEGLNFISNYLTDGAYDESPLPAPVFTGGGNILENTYHFKFHTNKYYIPDDGTLSPSVGGLYDTGTLLRSDGIYQIVVNVGDYEIKEVATNNVVYRSDAGTNLSLPDPWEPLTDGVLTRATFTSLTDANSKTRAYAVPIYARLLTNLTTVQATPTLALPDPDIDPNNSAYTRALPLTITDTNLIYSSLHQTAATEYRRYSSNAQPYPNEYFVRPANVGTEEPQPIGASDWQPFSLWFVKDATLRTLQDDASQTITNRNSYTFASALQAILQQLNPAITFLADSDHSQFLYGTNPIRTITQVPIISVKNDVKVGDYDTPARKADVRLDDFLNLIFNDWRCKWFIDASNRFRIEHIDWFENGGSYVSEQIAANVTTLVNKDTGYPWEFGQNEYEYDQNAIPERMEFRWMDEVSFPFEGYPINLTSGYVQKGNVRNIDISLFTTDVSFILANANLINKNGFVLFECDQIDALNYNVPYLTTVVNGTNYVLQNGYASFFFIHATYYQSRLPASDAHINAVAQVGITTERLRLQDMEVPATAIADFMQLITTSLGNGLITEYTENINSAFLNLKLRHGI